MQRPILISVISLLSCAAAVYLWTVGIAILVRPGVISLMAARHLMYGLELAGPLMMLLVGTGYALVGWGLFRLHNWARWLAMLIIAFSIVPLVPKISMADIGLPILWYGLQIALRFAAGWYLAQAPSVLDAFASKQARLHNGDTESRRNLT